MTREQLRFQCLDMAISIAKSSGQQADRKYIADLHDWLYLRVVESPDVAKEPPPPPVSEVRSKAKTDKAADLFK